MGTTSCFHNLAIAAGARVQAIAAPVIREPAVGISLEELNLFWRRRPISAEPEWVRAERQFNENRAELQRQFLHLASTSGKPRGLLWTQTDWKEDTAFARDLQTGLLTAFVGVEISFAAIPGGEMEDVEAVSQIRNASAVFHYQKGRWGTGGKALFNLSPPDAVERLTGQFAPIERHTK
ncbi:hypothetical protein [Planctomicrobium sp. SH527]|uniref:hypothetical protein n=1 Tax=Planctomicrobium sp. SH527 TaxID=3448123 RepID=UPI003F5BA433